MTKKKTDKEKSIKPKAVPNGPEHPSQTWPEIPEGVEYDWLRVLRDWLGQLAPMGEIVKYYQVKILKSKPMKVKVTFFTHTYRYVFEFTEKTIWGKALLRKPLAGTTATFQGSDIVDECKFTAENWRYVLNQILAWELVKLMKDGRTQDEWERFASNYIRDGEKYYHEWEQKGLEIRNQQVYMRTQEGLKRVKIA